MKATIDIPGYAYGSGSLAASPVTLEQLDLMKKTVLFTDVDVKYLQMSQGILEGQVEAILDVWYDFVASNPHLLSAFTNPADGKPIGEYLRAVRKRFGRWILDTARAEYDQGWLDYQHEIALRHHRTKKNRADGVASTAIVPFRDLFLLIFPVTFTLKPFLAKRGHAAEDVEGMYAAWVKSCLLQVTLWSRPYVKDGDF